jgi:hypothetical protein
MHPHLSEVLAELHIRELHRDAARWRLGNSITSRPRRRATRAAVRSISQAAWRLYVKS